MEESDPALSRDHLPQPYRMVWKVLDEYILDPAWLHITRLHPELLQDEDGKAFCTPHNQALQNICTPSSVTEQEYTYTSIMEREGLLFMSTDNGAFVIMDSDSNSIVQSIRLEEEELPKTAEQIEAEEAAKAAAADPKAKKGAPAANSTPPKPRKVTNMWISDASLPITSERLINFSVARIIEVEEDPSPDDVKKKGKGTESEEKPKIPKCIIFVVQAVLGMTEGFKSSLITLSVVGEVTIPLEAAHMNSVNRIDISPNGCLMCASTSLGCSVYQLPVKIDINRTKIGNVEQIAENGLDVPEETEVDLKNAEEEDEGGEKTKAPILDALLTLDLDFFDGNQVKAVTFFPLFHGKKSSEATLPTSNEDKGSTSAEAKDDSDQTNAHEPPGSENYYHTAMAVVFEKAPEWWIVGMMGIVDVPGTDVFCKKITAKKMHSWSLPSNASAFCLDGDRSTIAIGSIDGSVCMWNLITRALTSVMGRHEAAVSALCFVQCRNANAKDSASHYMVSGADDGTMCMYHLSIPLRASGFNGNLHLFAPPMDSSGSDEAACITSKFLNFRMDVNDGTSITSIRSIKGLPWAMVSCSDGMCMVYDVPNALLLGRLALYSGMTSRQVNWKILNFNEVGVREAPSVDGPESEAIAEQKAERGESGEGKIDDPNLFIRQPPGRRPTKYSMCNKFDWSKCVLLNTVAAPSKSCYHCVYRRSGLPVLASFRAEDLIRNFYPDLAGALTNRSKTSLTSIDLLKSFRCLSSEERLDSKLVIKNAMNFGEDFMDNLEPNSALNSSRGGSVPRRTSTSGAGGSRQPGRSGSLSSRGGGAAITKKNLDALQDALGTDAGSTKDNMNGSILKASYDRVVDPGAVATSSARGSRAERASRKQRLLNRLSSVSSAL